MPNFRIKARVEFEIEYTTDKRTEQEAREWFRHICGTRIFIPGRFDVTKLVGVNEEKVERVSYPKKRRAWDNVVSADVAEKEGVRE